MLLMLDSCVYHPVLTPVQQCALPGQDMLATAPEQPAHHPSLSPRDHVTPLNSLTPLQNCLPRCVYLLHSLSSKTWTLL